MCWCMRWWDSYLKNRKRGCVFPIAIWPAFRMGQYRVNNHPYHAPQFIIFEEVRVISVLVWHIDTPIQRFKDQDRSNLDRKSLKSPRWTRTNTKYLQDSWNLGPKQNRPMIESLRPTSTGLTVNFVGDIINMSATKFESVTKILFCHRRDDTGSRVYIWSKFRCFIGELPFMIESSERNN